MHDEKGKKLRRINQSSSKLLLSLVNDLLDLFQIKKKQYSQKLSQFNLVEALEETKEIFEI